MLKEFINRILELDKVEVLDLPEGSFSNKELHRIPRPKVQEILVGNTLRSVMDYLELNKDKGTDGIGIHVVSPEEVRVISYLRLEDGYTPEFFRATTREYETEFEFGRKYSQEEFIINMFSNFEINKDAERIIKLASKVVDEKINTSEDDGVSQQVTVKKGASLRDTETIQNPVVLKPYRTFREVDQPQSKFVFRCHQRDNEKPSFSITEASGNAWKLDAIQRIANYYKDLIPKDSSIVVIA